MMNRRGFIGSLASLSLLLGLDKLSIAQNDKSSEGELLIFREPEPGYDYTIGVDTGSWTGSDLTAISVWRKGKNGEPDVQCAEFASSRVSHLDAYLYVMPLVKRYGKFMNGKFPQEPLVSIEQVAAMGDICQNQLRALGHRRFFMIHQYSPVTGLKTARSGWRTTHWSRPILVDGFASSVENGWVKVNSRFLAKECGNIKTVYSKTGKKKLSVNDGNDSRFMAAAIAVISSHDMDV